MQETWVLSLGLREKPLEEEMATHSGILPSEIPGTEETGKLQVHGVTKESCTPWQLNNNNKPIST